MWEPQNELLTDTLVGEPIAATLCPIAHSGVVDRSVHRQTVELGAVGLEKGVFILYDRQTGTHWSQVSGRATRGARSGLSLRKKTWTVTTWGRWRRLHPETSVYADPNLPVPLALLLVDLPAASNPSEDARAALARGAALHQKGDLEGAVAAYRESLALAPRVEARSNLGAALAALGRYEEAIESHRGALAMVPSDGASGTTSLAAAIASAAR